MIDQYWDQTCNAYGSLQDAISAFSRAMRDRGWSECVDEGVLTQKIIYTALEAPFNILLGGLNFTVFGINLAQVFTFVMTAVVALFILRIIMDLFT